MLTTIKAIGITGAVTSGFMLLAVEDATLLQIVTLILTFLTTTIGTIMAYKMAQMTKAQTDAKAQVDHVILKVETIEKHTNSLTEKAVVQAEEKGTLAGKLAEKERVAGKATEDKLTADTIKAEVQKRLLELASPPIEKKLGAIGTDVEEVKGDVKDVKDKVVVKAVAAKEDTRPTPGNMGR